MTAIATEIAETGPRADVTAREAASALPGIDLARFYTPLEVADLLRCDRNTVYRSIQDRLLTAVRLGRTYRIPGTALAEFIEGLILPAD